MLYKTKAIILGGRDLREADKLLTFYSLDLGKRKAIAKGIRKTKSKFGANLEPFTLSKLLVYTKSRHHHDNLDIITDAEAQRSFKTTRESLIGFGCSSYMSEFLNEMVHEGEPSKPLFNLFYRFLSALEDGLDPFLVVSGFSMQAFGIFGYHPVIDRCCLCGKDIKKLKTGSVFFSTGMGGIMCSPCRKEGSFSFELKLPSIGYLKQLLKMHPDLLKSLRLNSVCKKEVEKVIRSYLSFYIEKELKSIKLLESTGVFNHNQQEERCIRMI